MDCQPQPQLSRLRPDSLVLVLGFGVLQPSVLLLAATVLSFLVLIIFYQWQDARFGTYVLLPATVLVGAIVANPWRQLPMAATVLCSAVACYLAIVPVDDILRPTRTAYDAAAVNPKRTLTTNRFVSLWQQGPRLRIDPRCLRDGRVLPDEQLPTQCKPLRYSNLRVYLAYLDRPADARAIVE